MDYSTHESCYNSIMSAARPRYSICRLLFLSIVSLAGCTANPVVPPSPTIPATLQSAPILPTRTIETTPNTPTPRRPAATLPNPELRAAAVSVDRSLEVDAREATRIWEDLLAGHWTLVDTFDAEGRRLLVGRRSDPSLPVRPLLSSTRTSHSRRVSRGATNPSTLGPGLGRVEKCRTINI